MFTGIVEAVGRIESVTEAGGVRRMRLVAPVISPELSDGDSVAVDGACLTVVSADSNGFEVDVIATTQDRTLAGSYESGAAVNLERAMVLGDRIDGHLVQGHVDGTGRFIQKVKDGDNWLMDFELPGDVYRQSIPRGSVTLNGVSLTLAELLDENRCRIGIIPFTYEHTNLGGLEPGDRVNVEGDLIGKYVSRVTSERGSA